EPAAGGGEKEDPPLSDVPSERGGSERSPKCVLTPWESARCSGRDDAQEERRVPERDAGEGEGSEQAGDPWGPARRHGHGSSCPQGSNGPSRRSGTCEPRRFLRGISARRGCF